MNPALRFRRYVVFHAKNDIWTRPSVWLAGRLVRRDTPTGAALLAMFGTIFTAGGAAIGVLWFVIELIFVRR